MRGKPVDHPRRIGKHVAFAIDHLAEAGATEIEVYKTKHVIVTFKVGRHELEVRTACTPRNEGHEINRLRQLIYRTVAEACAQELARR